MIVRNRAYLAGGQVPVALLQGALAEFKRGLPRLERAWAYYMGAHDILHRKRNERTANNRLVVNHAAYISDMAASYLIGSPVTYSDAQQAGMQALVDAYTACNADSVDAELAKHASVYGRGVELAYTGESAQPCVAALDPRRAFVVYDETVEHKPLFGVHLQAITDRQGTQTGWQVQVYTTTAVQVYVTDTGLMAVPVDRGETGTHAFGGVPMVEYWNNAEERGDFDRVLTLIDAYNLLMSDRVNDKEQLVDAILVLVGASLGDNESEVAATLKTLREEKIMELPAQNGVDAKFLVKQLTETEVQVLAKALTDDIHKIAMVPALTDEHFAATASGVAMKYKLLGFDQLTKSKERWFREGLRSRLRLFAHYLSVKGAARVDADSVQLTFTRGLPANELEQAQIVQTLQGIVPDEILLRYLAIVEDPAAALEMLKAQKEQAAAQQQALFGQYADANEGGVADEPAE